MVIRVAILAIRFGPRVQQALQRPADRRHRDPGGSITFFSPAIAGPPLGVAPEPGTHTPASPGRRGDGNRATTGPRSDSGPTLLSSAGSPAPPATGSPRDGPHRAGESS